MKIKTVYCEKQNKSIDQIITFIKNELGDFNSKFIIYFSSPAISTEEFSAKLKDSFQQSQIMGCTTAGEIVSGKMLKQSVVIMAISDEIIEDVKIEMISNIKEENNVHQVFKNFENYFKIPSAELDIKKYVGLILVDGLSGAEEKIMDTIGDLTNISFIGGSAGDDLQFKQTNVFANGKSVTNSAVVAVLKLKNGFDILKTQSFKQLDSKLVATKVNPVSRQVLEFNNQPAILAYSNALNCSKEEAANKFMHNPIGLMIDDEPFVRSPQQVKDESMIFYCNVLQNMELSVLESTDIISDTKNDLNSKIKELGGKISGMINFHCILRTLELEQKNLTDEYGKIFSDIPTVGFSTYGEEYIGHINQTSTILIFL